MRVSFFHDHWLTYSQDIYYSPGGLPHTVWKKYLEYFDEIVVATRCKKVDEIVDSKLAVSSCNLVSFDPVSSYNSDSELIFKFHEIRNQIINVLNKTDCAIIRLPSVIGLIACKEAIKLNKPWVAEVVGCAWDSYKNYGSVAGKIIAPIMFILNYHYVKKATHAIYVSESFLQGRYPTTGVQVSCSDVNITDVSEEILIRRLQKIDAGYNNRAVNFGLVGSLNVDYKGHETAIKALAAIKDKIPPFKLRFLGGGNKAKWEVLAREYGIIDSVEFCGVLPNGEPVLNWMDETDIYFIPSLQEGLPRALVEAMSRGCPSLGARTGGIPELLERECLHKPRDSKKLSQDILHLINNKEKLKQYAKHNFDIAKKYEKNLLSKKQRKFWSGFRSYVEHYQTQ